jgi:hypothetical protein
VGGILAVLEVLLRSEERVQLIRVGKLDLDHPSLLVGTGVDLSGVGLVAHRGVLALPK